MDSQDREDPLSGTGHQGQDDIVGQPQLELQQQVYPHLQESLDGSFGDRNQEHEGLGEDGGVPKTASHQGHTEQMGLMADQIEKLMNYTKQSEANRRTEAREREEEDEQRAAGRELDRQRFKYELQQDSRRLGTAGYQNTVPQPAIPWVSTTADPTTFPGPYADHLSKEARQRDQQDKNIQAKLLKDYKQAYDDARTKQPPIAKNHQRQDDTFNDTTRSRWVPPLEDSPDRQELQSKQVYKMLLLTKTKKMTREDLHSFDSWRNSLLNNIFASGVLPAHTWCRFVCHLWVYGLLSDDLVNLAEAEHQPKDNLSLTSEEYIAKLKALFVTAEDPRQARFNFNSCKQNPTESIEAYHANLMKLYNKGQFNDPSFFVAGFLEGLSSSIVRDQLLKEEDMNTAVKCLQRATHWRQVTISQLQYRNWGQHDYDGLKTHDVVQNASTEAFLAARRTDRSRPSVVTTPRYQTARVLKPSLPDISGHLNVIDAYSDQPLFGDADGDEELRMEEAPVIQQFWEEEPQEEEEICDLTGGADRLPARSCWTCGQPGHLRAQCQLRRASRLGRAAALDFRKGGGQRFGRNINRGGGGGGRGGGAGKGGPIPNRGF